MSFGGRRTENYSASSDCILTEDDLSYLTAVCTWAAVCVGPCRLAESVSKGCVGCGMWDVRPRHVGETASIHPRSIRLLLRYVLRTPRRHEYGCECVCVRVSGWGENRMGKGMHGSMRSRTSPVHRKTDIRIRTVLLSRKVLWSALRGARTGM